MTTNTNKAGAIARARAWLREDTAKRARLPRAVCYICGGNVTAGTGAVGKSSTSTTLTDADRTARGLAPELGWSRWHEHCAIPAHAAAAILGRPVSADIAAEAMRIASQVVGSFSYAPSSHTHFKVRSDSGKAWQHVTSTERDELAKAVESLERAQSLRTTPHACTSGPCAWCGVRLSLGWFRSPERWDDGSPAPICMDCNTVTERRTTTSDPLQLRAHALEALSGASGMFLAQALGGEMRTYSDLVPAGAPGTAERWTYASEAWDALRERARRMFPGSLPIEIREHYRALASAEHAAARARTAHEQQQAEAAASRAAGWPVP